MRSILARSESGHKSKKMCHRRWDSIAALVLALVAAHDWLKIDGAGLNWRPGISEDQELTKRMQPKDLERAFQAPCSQEWRGITFGFFPRAPIILPPDEDPNLARGSAHCGFP